MSPVPFPWAEVAPLRTFAGTAGPRSSGFRNVYWHHSRKLPWVAKVKAGGALRTLGRRSQPHEAALLVALWYRERYGPAWARVVASHDRRRPPFKAWYSRTRACWLLAVWELGERQEVVRFRRDGRPGSRLMTFASEAEAERYVRVWAVLRYGLFAAVALCR